MNIIELIKSETEKYFDLDISKKSRKREYIKARWTYFKLCQKILGKDFRFEAVGKSVNKDHTTVIHGINNFDTYSDIKRHYNYLFKHITSILELDIEIDEHLKADFLKDKLKASEIENKRLKDFYKEIETKHKKVKLLENNFSKYEAINELLTQKEEDILECIEYKIKPHLKMVKSKVTNEDLIKKQYETRVL